MLKKNIKNLEIRPKKQGLYDPEFERDSCGVGPVSYTHLTLPKTLTV